eukprot:5273688-Pyramimonas_sp.AAC.1
MFCKSSSVTMKPDWDQTGEHIRSHHGAVLHEWRGRKFAPVFQGCARAAAHAFYPALRPLTV